MNYAEAMAIHNIFMSQGSLPWRGIFALGEELLAALLGAINYEIFHQKSSASSEL
jgi:hypothetical protein